MHAFVTCGIRFKYEGQTHVLIKADARERHAADGREDHQCLQFSHTLSVGEPQLTETI